MRRAIVGYRRDHRGDWVAELVCGHERHVRHQPPFQLRPWILEPEGRRERLGTSLECGLCDQGVPAPSESRDRGGDPACFAQVLCPDCGAVLDGGPHGPACVSAT